jgi:hypothetical protein
VHTFEGYVKRESFSSSVLNLIPVDSAIFYLEPNGSKIVQHVPGKASVILSSSTVGLRSREIRAAVGVR